MTRKLPVRSSPAHAADGTCHLDLGIVCVHVISGERPVLLLWRDREDAALGLACGRSDHPTVDDWGMAHVFPFVADDPAMGVMRTVPAGEAVRRDRVGAPWRKVTLRGG